MAAQAQWYRARGDVATAERLEAQLKVIGRCKRCGRGLTNPTSVRRGIGPECWTKEPTPWLPA
jgi:hypothetical protein